MVSQVSQARFRLEREEVQKGAGQGRDGYAKHLGRRSETVYASVR